MNRNTKVRLCVYAYNHAIRNKVHSEQDELVIKDVQWAAQGYKMSVEDMVAEYEEQEIAAPAGPSKVGKVAASAKGKKGKRAKGAKATTVPAAI